MKVHRGDGGGKDRLRNAHQRTNIGHQAGEESAMRQVAIPVLALLVASCTAGPQEQPVVGADRDAHGCIGSAGYSWCESTQQCERPWELAQSQGFENSPEEFDRFCRGV